jgi:hypothetical protein
MYLSGGSGIKNHPQCYRIQCCTPVRTPYPRHNVPTYHHVNKNSLRTGDPENSGFKRMQLLPIRRRWICRRITTYFRKYCKPVRRFSKNLGRNFDITLFGGRGGIAASELGKVWRSLCLRSSNSENRFRMRIEPPCTGKQLDIMLGVEDLHAEFPP